MSSRQAWPEQLSDTGWSNFLTVRSLLVPKKSNDTVAESSTDSVSGCSVEASSSSRSRRVASAPASRWAFQCQRAGAAGGGVAHPHNSRLVIDRHLYCHTHGLRRPISAAAAFRMARSGSSLDKINLGLLSPARHQPSSGSAASLTGRHQRHNYEQVASPKTIHEVRNGDIVHVNRSPHRKLKQQQLQLTGQSTHCEMLASNDSNTELDEATKPAIGVLQPNKTETVTRVPSVLQESKPPIDLCHLGGFGQTRMTTSKAPSSRHSAEDELDGLIPEAPMSSVGNLPGPQVVGAQWQPPQSSLPPPLQPMQLQSQWQSQQKQQKLHHSPQHHHAQQHRSWVAVTSTLSSELSAGNSSGALGTVDPERASFHSGQREPQTAVGYFTERERRTAAAAAAAASATGGQIGRQQNNNSHRHLKLKEEIDAKEVENESVQGQRQLQPQDSQLAAAASNSKSQRFIQLAPEQAADFADNHNSRPQTGTTGDQNPVRRVEKKPVTYGYNWLLEFNKMSVTEAEIERRVKNGGKLRNSATQTTRFELPFDVRDLEGMDPKDYLRQYTVVSSRRMYLYQKVFQKYKNPNLNAIEIKDLPKCISDIIVGGISEEKLDEVLELTCLKNTGIQLDAKLFYAFCAVVERQTTGKKVPDDPSEVMESHKQRLECADFIGLNYRFHGVNLSEKMSQLLRAL